jgi:hypothetical protein
MPIRRTSLVWRMAFVALIGACLLLGQAWYQALREWLAAVMGQVDLEYAGFSLLLVPPVAVGTIALLGILDAFGRGKAAIAVGAISAVVLLLALVDNVVGALADGDISSLGWRIGLLSGVMAGAVVAATAIVAWRGWSPSSPNQQAVDL